jgi:hypothetical protein
MKNPHACLLVAGVLMSACSSTSAQPSAQQTSKPDATAPAVQAGAGPASKMPEGTNINSEAKLMADFKVKVDDYLKLRKSVESQAPAVKKTDKPQELLTAEKALAANVRAARANAKRGDFFTPATQALFRRLLNPAIKGPEAAENKGAIKEDGPEPKDVPFQVNADYPRDESLSTVPPDVLRALPQLPPEIQYRFVGPHLILYDVKPNMIVDFMLNAVPPMAPKKQ